MFEIEEYNESNIVKLSKMLKSMPIEKAQFIVLNLINELSEKKPRLINILKNELCHIETILEEFEKKELNLILSKFDDKDLGYIYLKDSYIIEKNFSKNRVEEIKNSKESSTETVLRKLSEILKINNIFYSGVLNSFENKVCIESLEEKNMALIISKKNFYKKGETIDLEILLFEEVYKDTVLLYFYKDGKEFFPSDRKYMELRIENKHIKYTLEGFYQEGLNRIYLAEAKTKKILAVKDLIIVSSNKASLKGRIVSKSIIGEKLSFAIDINSEEELKYKVFCKKCGSLIAGGITKLSNKKHILEFYTNKHHSKYLLNLSNNLGHNLVLSVDAYKRDISSKDIKISHGKLYIDKDFGFKLCSKEYLKMYYVLAEKTADLSYFETNLTQENLIKDTDNFAKKGISEHLLSNNLKLFYNSPKEVLTGIIQLEENKDFVKKFKFKKAFANGVKLLFFVEEKNSFKLHREYNVNLERENQMTFDFPHFVQKSEVYIGEIIYYMKDKVKLRIEDGNTLDDEEIQGFGIKKVLIKEKTRFRISLIENDVITEKLWLASNRKILKERFYYLNEGKTLKCSGDIRLMASTGNFMYYLVTKGILAFPWGCAEQTSSKLAAIAYIYNVISEEKRKDMNIKLLEGFKRLKLMNKEGLYSMWADSENYRIEISEIVYKNLLVYKEKILNQVPHEIEEIKKEVLMELELVLEEKIERKKTSLYLRYMSGEDREMALKYVREEAHIKKGNIYYKEKNIWGGNSYATLQALEIILKERIKKLDVISDIDYLDTEIKEGFIKETLKKFNITKAKYKKEKNLIRKPVDDILYRTLNWICRESEQSLVASTQGTMQLIRILKYLDKKEEKKFVINNKNYQVLNKDLNLDELDLKVIQGSVFVKTSFEQEEHLLKSAVKKIKIDVLEKNIRTKSHFKIKINTSKHGMFCPYIRIYTPAHIEILSSEAVLIDEQMYEIADIKGDMEILARVTKPGKGFLRAKLGGMYNRNKYYFSNFLNINTLKN